MTDIDVRALRPGEERVVAELRWRWLGENREVPTVPHGEYLDFFVDWIARHPDHHCTVADRDGTLIGMAWLAVLGRVPSPTRLERASGDLQSVYVVPEERGSGVGARLLDAVLAGADALELGHMTVHSSDGAVSLYERAGFAQGRTYLVREP